MDDERLAAITAAARATRKRPSRGLWLAAGVVGIVAAIGFVLLLLADGSPTPARKPAAVDGHDYGFAGGLVVGLVAGVVLGWVMSRHSSRSKP